MNSETEQSVAFQLDGVTLHGDLTMPEGAFGIVLFAHGSGSSRRSPRNRYVARLLNQGKLATLLVDLLTMEEGQIDARTAHLRFDIGLLAGRLIAMSDGLTQHRVLQKLRLGYFGASTGAAAALVAAAERTRAVRAVVSRGGRPDLAGPYLERVVSPTLLIVGGKDDEVIDLNRLSAEKLRVEKKIVIVPGANHLFEEPGALDEVARHAREWFERHLGRAAAEEARKSGDGAGQVAARR